MQEQTPRKAPAKRQQPVHTKYCVWTMSSRNHHKCSFELAWFSVTRSAMTIIVFLRYNAFRVRSCGVNWRKGREAASLSLACSKAMMCKLKLMLAKNLVAACCPCLFPSPNAAGSSGKHTTYSCLSPSPTCLYSQTCSFSSLVPRNLLSKEIPMYAHTWVNLRMEAMTKKTQRRHPRWEDEKTTARKFAPRTTARGRKETTTRRAAKQGCRVHARLRTKCVW